MGCPPGDALVVDRINLAQLYTRHPVSAITNAWCASIHGCFVPTGWPRLLDLPTGATAELYRKRSPPTEAPESVPMLLSGLSVRVSELKERINTTVCVNARKAGAWK
jgi:hypothetical protein